MQAPLIPGISSLIEYLTHFTPQNDMGPTVYALTVSGEANGRRSRLVGPAISEASVTQDWPEAVREVAKGLFAKTPFGRKAGTVAVILVVEYDHEMHCVVINVPTEASKQARRDAQIPMSCAASVLAGYC